MQPGGFSATSSARRRCAAAGRAQAARTPWNPTGRLHCCEHALPQRSPLDQALPSGQGEQQGAGVFIPARASRALHPLTRTQRQRLPRVCSGLCDGSVSVAQALLGTTCSTAAQHSRGYLLRVSCAGLTHAAWASRWAAPQAGRCWTAGLHPLRGLSRTTPLNWVSTPSAPAASAGFHRCAASVGHCGEPLLCCAVLRCAAMHVAGTFLGAGSFGKVFRGRWNGLDCAVKVIEHTGASAEEVQQEMEILMSLQHPNIVRYEAA